MVQTSRNAETTSRFPLIPRVIVCHSYLYCSTAKAAQIDSHCDGALQMSSYRLSLSPFLCSELSSVQQITKGKKVSSGNGSKKPVVLESQGDAMP